MPLSNSERQRRYRRQVQTGRRIRIDLCLPEDVGNKLGYLAEYWGGTKTQALSQCLLEAWERAGEPIPGFEEDE
ncbi:MAG: hypothetical protein GY774_10685 [Planctomycetes bacterium]|nr:hypothetical protein [Planctomycetota bacterium]